MVYHFALFVVSDPWIITGIWNLLVRDDHTKCVLRFLSTKARKYRCILGQMLQDRTSTLRTLNQKLYVIFQRSSVPTNIAITSTTSQTVITEILAALFSDVAADTDGHIIVHKIPALFYNNNNSNNDLKIFHSNISTSTRAQNLFPVH